MDNVLIYIFSKIYVYDVWSISVMEDNAMKIARNRDKTLICRATHVHGLRLS